MIAAEMDIVTIPKDNVAVFQAILEKTVQKRNVRMTAIKEEIVFRATVNADLNTMETVVSSESVLITAETEGNVQMECVYAIQDIKVQIVENRWSVKPLRAALMAVPSIVSRNATIRKSAVCSNAARSAS